MQKTAKTLCGISLGFKTTNINNQSARDCGTLWKKFQNEKIAEKITQKKNHNIFAVYHDYDGDHTKPYSYFIGCEVEEGTEIPKGLESLQIPEANYEVITAKGEMPNCVANAWREIWKTDDLSRAYKADFEIYDERSYNWQNAEVDIYIGLK